MILKDLRYIMYMKNKLEVLFCGSLNDENTSSWDKTNGYFIRAIEKKANCESIDYSIRNRYFRKLYNILSKLIYGETLIRNPLNDFLMDFNFKNIYKKLYNQPDLVVHSSNISIPKSLENNSIHVLYTDASVMGAIKFNNLNPKEKTFRIFKKETNKYINRLKYIFTFNEWTRQSLIDDFYVDRNKVINVGFGANLNPYHGLKDYASNHLLIVLRRGLEKNKGLLLLLEAFKIAYKQNPSLKLSVVGTSLEPIEGVTYYEGYPREKTIELFHQASLYAMPALFEPNGMVYIEALACKTPILGLNRLAFPEFCGNGAYGFIVEPNAEDIAQTIVSAFNSPETLKKMGESGQDYVVNRFNWDTVVQTIINKSIN